MSDWTETTLGEVADLLVGFAFKSSRFSDDANDVRLLRGVNIGQGKLDWERCAYWPGPAHRHARYELRDGDVVLAMDRPWIEAGLKRSRVREKDLPALLVQRVTRLRGTSLVLTSFIHHLLATETFSQYLQAIVTGATVPHISQSQIASYQFRLPSLQRQERICSTLDALDDLIENNRRRVELLEQMAQVIYREWFVRFRYPGHHQAVLVESSMGPIPDGWQVTTIGDVLELRYGKALKAADRKGGHIAVVGSSEVVGWHDEELTPGPAIVVGRKGNVGNVIWVPGPCWPIDTTYYVASELPLPYVSEQLKRAEFINSHAAVPGLSREQAYSLPFLLPPDHVMSAFAEVSDTLGSEVVALRRQIQGLGNIRDLTLPKLVTGQIDVSKLDLDALVESVA